MKDHWSYYYSALPLPPGTRMWRYGSGPHMQIVRRVRSGISTIFPTLRNMLYLYFHWFPSWNFQLNSVQSGDSIHTPESGKHSHPCTLSPIQNTRWSLLPPDSTTYQEPEFRARWSSPLNWKAKRRSIHLTMDYDKRFDDFLTVDYVSFLKEHHYKDRFL